MKVLTRDATTPTTGYPCLTEQVSTQQDGPDLSSKSGFPQQLQTLLIGSYHSVPSPNSPLVSNENIGEPEQSSLSQGRYRRFDLLDSTDLSAELGRIFPPTEGDHLCPCVRRMQDNQAYQASALPRLCHHSNTHQGTSDQISAQSTVDGKVEEDRDNVPQPKRRVLHSVLDEERPQKFLIVDHMQKRIVTTPADSTKTCQASILELIKSGKLASQLLEMASTQHIFMRKMMDRTECIALIVCTSMALLELEKKTTTIHRLLEVIRSMHSELEYYMKKSLSKYWDGYDNQPIVRIDDSIPPETTISQEQGSAPKLVILTGPAFVEVKYAVRLWAPHHLLQSVPRDFCCSVWPPQP